MPINSVPVDMYGINIGTADISDDGVITLQIEPPCQFGIELMGQLQEPEFFTGITLLPRGVNPVPITPMPASDEPVPDPETTEV